MKTKPATKPESKLETIFHITTETEWADAKKNGAYTAPSLEKAGFIHCSRSHQIPAVANYNFKGQSGLILLEIQESKVGPKVVYEDLGNEGQEFPHIYGLLNLDAVVRTWPFPAEKNGTFKLPAGISTP